MRNPTLTFLSAANRRISKFIETGLPSLIPCHFGVGIMRYSNPFRGFCTYNLQAVTYQQSEYLCVDSGLPSIICIL